jgi:hypothetical protein
MKARCHDPKSAGYRFYGSRGITVCEKWLSDRAAFFKWTEENGYREGLQLEREKDILGIARRTAVGSRNWLIRTIAEVIRA